MKKNIMFIILGIVITLGIGVFAVYRMEAKDVSYNSTDVKTALDTLYQKVNSMQAVPNDLHITISDVGTTTMKVNVTEEFSNVSYIYIVNGKIVSTIQEKSYTVDKLEPETTYTIQVLVQDENGTIHMGTMRQRTSDAVWLYKDGVEYDLAGGFDLHGYVGGDNYTLTKEDTYMRMNVPSNKRATFMREENIIDFSNYKKVYIKYNNSNDNLITVFVSERDNYNGYDSWNEALGYEDWSAGEHLVAIDTSNYNGNAYVYVRKTHAGYVDIERIWLEEN